MWRRRLSQSGHARSGCSQTTASRLTLPRLPSSGSAPRRGRLTVCSGSWRGAGRVARHHVPSPCLHRRRRVPSVCRLMTPYPRRVLAHSWVHPSTAQGPVPPADGVRLGGRLHAVNPVVSGGMVRRKRANRLGRTALTRRASAANAQPMSPASAQRVPQHRPCLRGGPSLPHPASQTRCRPPCDPMGELTPPGGAPWSGSVRAPDASTPAWSPVPRRRTMPPSLPRGWLHSRRWPQARWSNHPLTSASTFQAMVHVRPCARSSWSAGC